MLRKKFWQGVRTGILAFVQGLAPGYASKLFYFGEYLQFVFYSKKEYHKSYV